MKDYFLWDQDKDKEEKKDRDKKDKDKEIKVPKKKEEAPKKKEEVIKKKEDKLKWKRKKMVPSGNKAEQSIAILYLSHNDPYRYIVTKMSLKFSQYTNNLMKAILKIFFQSQSRQVNCMYTFLEFAHCLKLLLQIPLRFHSFKKIIICIQPFKEENNTYIYYIFVQLN